MEECWLKMTEADANGDLEEFREVIFTWLFISRLIFLIGHPKLASDEIFSSMSRSHFQRVRRSLPGGEFQSSSHCNGENPRATPKARH